MVAHLAALLARCKRHALDEPAHGLAGLAVRVRIGDSLG
jgi:hypothetical protein